MVLYQLLPVALLIYHVVELPGLVQWSSDLEDVMGTYFVANGYQCGRLCWYRKLCQTYSYSTSQSQAADINCFLHASRIATTTTGGVPFGWVEKRAYWDETIEDNACRTRPCADSELCVPTFASPFHACLHSPTECLAPSRYDGVYSDLKLLQGQTTQFTCNSPLAWAPRAANKTVACQVTGRYSGLQGTCENATYYAPRVPFSAPLPDVAAPGWEACIKGNFTASGSVVTRFSINLHNGQNFSCDADALVGGDIYLALDLRQQFSGVQNKTLWFTALSGCRWSKTHEIGPLPLTPHTYFEMTLGILDNNTMQILVKGAAPLQLDLTSAGTDLTNATRLEILRDVNLTFVDLGRAC